MTNVPSHCYGILICLDTDDEGKLWYRIILHEMSHIFCIVNELNGENFQDKYSKENMTATDQYTVSSVGYAIWKEFIADYIACQLNPFGAQPKLSDLRNHVHRLVQDIRPGIPTRAQSCSMLLCYLMLRLQNDLAADREAALRLIRKERLIPAGKNPDSYDELIGETFTQLCHEPFWEIELSFILLLGGAYLKLLYC